MLRIINHNLFKIRFRHQFSRTYNNNIQRASIINAFKYNFSKNQSKKHDSKKKNQQSKPPTKLVDNNLTVQKVKSNIVEIRNMQTTSQETLQQDSLKAIIIEQRNVLQKSLQEEINPTPDQFDKLSKRAKIILKYLRPQQCNRYYIKRPLKYLQKILISLIAVNISFLGWHEYSNLFNSIGWFYGYFTTPASTSVLALLLGYNLAFWVVRHSFNLHLPLSKIEKINISLVSTTWRNLLEISLIISQFLLLASFFTFGYPIQIYKIQLILAVVNYLHLFINLQQILRFTRTSIRNYYLQYMRIVIFSAILIFIFGLYSQQVKDGEKPIQVSGSQSYRERIKQIYQGYQEYLNFFKKKKYQMKQDEKINPFDSD